MSEPLACQHIGCRDNLDSLLPESKEYVALATEAAESQVCVDLFFLAQVGKG